MKHLNNRLITEYSEHPESATLNQVGQSDFPDSELGA